jgi:hypothetical protein
MLLLLLGSAWHSPTASSSRCCCCGGARSSSARCVPRIAATAAELLLQVCFEGLQVAALLMQLLLQLVPHHGHL